MTSERVYASGRFILLSAAFLLIAGFGMAGPLPFVRAVVMVLPVVLLCGVPAYAGRFLCRFFSTDWPYLSKTIFVQAFFIGISALVLDVVWLLYSGGVALFIPGYLDVNCGRRMLPVIAAGMIILLLFAQIIHYFIRMLEERKRASERSLDKTAFSRVHRSYILNIRHVARLDPIGRESFEAVLRNGAKVPVSASGIRALPWFGRG